jgi:arylsulfatase
MTDQQRWDAMGCSGGWVRTPHLDRIASEGVRFTNCVTTSPICVSARVSLATGRYPHTTGVWSNAVYTLPPDAPTWMRAVRELGYRTSLFGKTHLHPHHPGEPDLRENEALLHEWGLDDVNEIAGPRATAWGMSHMAARWESLGLLDAYRADFEERFANKHHVVRPSVLPLEEYADVYVGNCATEYLERYDRSEPWCCWVSFGGPHEPWDTPGPWSSMYRPADMPPPAPPLEPDLDRPRGSLDRFLSFVAPDFDDGEELRMRADYAGNVSLIDDQIGRILDTVEARGELDNTVIVFSSDHGEMNGDHGLIYKMNFFDGAVRVPLLVRTPETARSGTVGTVNDSPAEWLDIGPTLIEAAGGEPIHRQFGRSLLPALNGSSHRDEAISEFEGEIMLMNDEWKLVVNRRGEPYLLFDRSADPLETTNLAADPSFEIVRRDLKARMLDRVLSSQVEIR